jgi:hypothetical protein
MAGGRINVGFGAKPYRLLASAGKYQHMPLPVGLTPTGVFGSNNLTHGQPFTITGSGFGTKATVTPLMVDRQQTAGSGAVSSVWSGATPTAAPAGYNTQQWALGTVFPTGFNPGAPNTHVKGIIGGSHYETGGSSGQAVSTWLNYTIPGWPVPTLCAYRWRGDPNWVYGQGVPADDNTKCYVFGLNWGEFPQANYYLAYGDPGPGSNSITSFQMTSDGAATSPAILQNPDANGNSGIYFKDVSTPNPYNGWLPWEVMSVLTNQTGLAGGGYIKAFMGTNQFVNYAGSTDTSSNLASGMAINGYPNRTFEIPSPYARSQNPNNWVYWADVYFDIGAQNQSAVPNVVLGDQPTWAACTTRVYQVPTAWADGSITFTCWAGEFPVGSSVYIHVTNGSGTIQNAVGGIAEIVG